MTNIDLIASFISTRYALNYFYYQCFIISDVMTNKANCEPMMSLRLKLSLLALQI